MTQQDDITQRLRDNADLDEAEHGNARVVQLEREAADEIERLRALLSKLRAPVSSIREGFELTYAADADDPACASDLSHFTNGWRACVMSQVRAPVADEEDQPTAPNDDAIAECWVSASDIDGIAYDGPSFERGYRAALASAPVAGEAQIIGYVPPLYLEMRRRGMPVNSKIQHSPSDDATAPLYAAPQASAEAFDFVAHLARQAEFSARTFGPGARVAGVCDHIRKELIEVETSGGDLKEWVDVIILGLDGAWRSGATPQEIIAAIVAKQAKNEARTWPDWRTVDPTKAIEHDRGGQP
ncbi:dATP/dGTP pyrophosphohydrolase domain-containing protein [Achromobacter xylosoxidans]|uniref:dATP/dGTP pyrophosphohydrolase domain-containing protein n=1 Tax=Alcaligenes xylosoxydans xylosoxydans TaxID=85698 RepID=UPI003D2C8332